jgi:hypothetical protein
MSEILKMKSLLAIIASLLALACGMNVYAQEGTNLTSGCIDSISRKITINALPPPAIEGNKTVCTGITELYSTIYNPDYSYKWRANTGDIITTDTLNTVEIKWLSEGSGTLTLFIKENSTNYKDTSELLIKINKSTEPQIIGSATALKGSTEYYAVTGRGDSKFKWVVQGGQIFSTISAIEILVLWGNGSNGSVKVIAVTPENCVDSTEKNVNLIVSDVEEQANTNNRMIEIYPNPVSDFLEVSWNNELKPISQKTEIYSVLGCKLIESELKNRIDVSALNPGFYYLKAGNKFIKFMKL